MPVCGGSCPEIAGIRLFVTVFCDPVSRTASTCKLHMPFYNSINRPWEIIGDVGRGTATLRIGHQRVALADVREISPDATRERDFLGSLFNYSAYLIVAAIFMVLVVQGGWRERFLLATVFFAIVGATSLIDIGLSTRIQLYRLTIATGDGQTIDFTTADAAEADRLTATLTAAIRTH